MNETLTWEKLETAVVFRFHGSIESDLTAALRQRIVSVTAEEGTEAAIFDLSDATYIDSMGIGMFVHLHVQNHKQLKFLFCELSRPVLKAFGYVKLISFFDIRDSLNDALEDLEIADS